jgi:hypothetical protein
MVSVFLRMLESHSGSSSPCLILTASLTLRLAQQVSSSLPRTASAPSTKRSFLASPCSSFFSNRFALTHLFQLFHSAITYPNLDKAKRKHIWSQFLELAKVEIRDSGDVVANGGDEKGFVTERYLEELATYHEFNGRCIKNLVRSSLPVSSP